MTPRLPSPYQVACSLVALAGAGLVWVNRVQPDESRALGAALLVVAALLFYRSERPATWRLVEPLLVLVLVFAGGEWMVRRQNAAAQRAYASTLMRFVPDPELKYEMLPGVHQSAGVTNELGMLDVARPLAQPPGTLRVACLGDSVGGDFRLPRENACATMERLLSTSSRHVEVLNFSVPGYNTMQEARALEVKAAPFGFDAVVVLFVVNDPYPELAIAHMLPGHLKFEHLLYSAARMAVNQRPLDPFGFSMDELFSAKDSWDGVVVRGMDRIAAAARERHAPVVVAVFPVLVEDSVQRYGSLYAKVVREAEQHGFVGLDLSRTAYAGHSMREFLKPDRDVIHPNAVGHRLAAEAIAAKLGPLLGGAP